MTTSGNRGERTREVTRAGRWQRWQITRGTLGASGPERGRCTSASGVEARPMSPTAGDVARVSSRRTRCGLGVPSNGSHDPPMV